MKLSTEKTENCQVILNIEVEPPEMEKYLDEAYLHLVEKYKVPGFRKGKTPRPILESYLGQGALVEHALEHLVPELCNKAIEEQKITAISYPDVEITELEPVKFKATISVQPTVELGDYHDITVTPDKIEVTEKDIEDTMEQLREQKANWEPVIRPVAINDMVKIDVRSIVGNETVIDEKERYYTVKKDSLLPIPGFAEQLVDMEPGQAKKFNLSFSAEYEDKNLAGKDYTTTVTVHEIKEKHLPDVNDDFAKSIGDDVDSVEALRKRLETNLKLMAESNARQALEDKIINEITQISKVCFPPVMVEQEIGKFLTDMARQFGGGETGLNTFLKSSGKTLEEIKNELKPSAENKITRSLILGEISQNANLTVADDEINTYLEEIINNDPTITEDMSNAIKSPSGRETARQILLVKKTLQHLVDIVTNTSTSVTEEIAQTEKAVVPTESEIK